MMRRKRSSPSIAADGQPARLELQTAASHDVLHPFHGHLTQITQQGADGGFGRYRLIIEPWLAFLGYNRDSYLFQDKWRPSAARLTCLISSDHSFLENGLRFGG